MTLTDRAAARAARSALSSLLRRLTSGHLTVVDTDGTSRSYGSASEPLKATITIDDERAWTAVARRGSIGLGEAYRDRWWDADDVVAALRIMIANLGPLDEIRKRLHTVTGPIGSAARRVRPRLAVRERDRVDIAAHYDLGNEFFALFLDETLTYSSAVFIDPVADLAAASVAKYDRLLAKLGVNADTRILEIGTGWGGFVLHAATVAGATVTTTTVSEAQRSAASARVAEAGPGDRVTVLGSDWRDLSGTYDRIVSIEMIEAVDWRDYERFFATIERCLAPDGLVGLQAICVPDRRYERAKTTEDFIRRYIFPGGNLASLGSIVAATSQATKLQLIDVEDLSAHYGETLRRWRVRFDEQLPAVRALGFDDEFCRLWRFYLAYCEAGFSERHCTVDQLVLAGPDWRPDGLALRPA